MSVRVELLEGLRIAFSSLRGNRLRTGLTTLGIGIGVATLLSIIGIIQGLNSSFERQLASLGSNMLVVSRWPWVMSGDWWMYRKRKPLSVDLVERVRAQSSYIPYASPMLTRSTDVAYGGEQITMVDIVGVDQDYLEIGSLEVTRGRFLSEADSETRQAVVVIGSDVADSFFADTNPLGRTLRIDGRPFTVVGTLARKGRLLDRSQDLRVFIPFRTFAISFGRLRGLSIALSVGRAEDMKLAEDQLVGILRRARGTPPGEPDDFTINRTETLARTYEQLTGALYAVAVGVGLITLLVGGIGIMNIMLVSVRERTREIGIRRALGARKRTIVLQFLLEASAVSAVGGALGTAVGLGLAKVVSLLTPLAAEVQPLTVLGGVAFAAMVGLLFGIWPAARAANLDPVEALRYE